MIKPVKGGFKVYSEKGRGLSKTLTKKGAIKRLKQVEWFKKHSPKK